MNGWFDVSKSKADDFYFVLKSGNGEIVLTSEMYKSRDSAETGIASVQTNSADDFRYERATASDGKFHFNGLSINNDYEVKAEFEGAVSKTRTLSVFDQRKKAGMDLKLEKK